MTELVHYEQSADGVVTLTLDDPKTRNALTGSLMVDQLLAAFTRIERDSGVRVLIITAAGKVFSSGGNINDMQRQIGPEVGSAALRQEYRHGIQRLPLALHALEVPTIAAVNGPAIGAGCDLACMCDVRIAAEGATFAESFVKLGLVPGDGGAWFLPRLIGMARAAEMSFTGDAIDAGTALDWGLVSRVVPVAELLPAAHALASRMAANSPDAVRLTKRLLRESQHARLDVLLELSAAYQALAHKTQAHAEAVDNFVSRQAARKSGS
ncbi:crotonase/enoyl-CoA hydratase family protein [Achromobacter seleniivolatilans]|uniref:Crotonase/enoyl-CoA hydratase family protein n=1 Tax=Achromobacter seleniivolatilans TaxID=3047478 RepID=A0ABY9M4H7_9BURK|nr:crotonase/enoyl-CoA hydratase family protein [Achromobacter sp. R39]WMD21088.1 crotonase/enoyl-CoA hydratase family protein [Achromobacter sp. R39]